MRSRGLAKVDICCRPSRRRSGSSKRAGDHHCAMPWELLDPRRTEQTSNVRSTLYIVTKGEKQFRSVVVLGV
jgi:hypothetical protein